MAKRSKGRGKFKLARYSSGKPTIIRQTKTIVKRSKGGHGRGAGNFLSARNIGFATGAFALGFIRKQFPNIPELPFIGIDGTIAVIAHYVSGGRPGLADNVCVAALVAAGLELGETGKVVGDGGFDMNGYVAGA